MPELSYSMLSEHAANLVNFGRVVLTFITKSNITFHRGPILVRQSSGIPSMNYESVVVDDRPATPRSLADGVLGSGIPGSYVER